MLAAFVIALLIWRMARKHGPTKFAFKLNKTRGLSSPAARSVAARVKADRASSIKPNKFGKR
jgi:hypothetical protein